MEVPVNAFSDPLFGKRILHVASPARWNNDKYNVERCSNWKVLIDTIHFLPMCHHYILIPENNTLKDWDDIYSMNNVTMIPFPYPQSVMQNRFRFEASILSQILAGRRKVEFRKGYFTTLEMSSIDIDFVFCHQPEILSNVLWSMLTQNYSVNNTDAFGFYHWIDCDASRKPPNRPPTFFRQFEAIDRCSSVFFHSQMSKTYLLQNFSKDSRVLTPDEYVLEMKIRKMPLTAKKLLTDGSDWWIPPKDIKPIAFNHRFKETTGRSHLPNLIEGLPNEYKVFCTDREIIKPSSGYSPVKDDGRFNYAYDEKYLAQTDDRNSFYLYSDFLKKSYAAVAIIKDYGTWNLSVQDPINLGTPTLVYDTPMMREVLGDNYPLFFKTKTEFQKKIQKLPKTFNHKIPDHAETFRNELQNAMKVSWQTTKKNKGGDYTKPWLFFVLNGLEYKKDFINQTHPGMVDGHGSNSWESIRRWCLQFGLKDDPNSRHTRLFIPDDETKKKVEKHLEGFNGTKYSMQKHKDFHWMLNQPNEPPSLSGFFT